MDITDLLSGSKIIAPFAKTPGGWKHKWLFEAVPQTLDAGRKD